MEQDFLVRGGNAVTLAVKPIRAPRLYVCARAGPEMTVRGRVDVVPVGAVLWCVVPRDGDGPVRARAVDGGLYDALRLLGGHVPDGYEAELEGLAAAAGGEEAARDSARPAEIERIRGRVRRDALALEDFAAAFFAALRGWHAVLRAAASAADPDLEAVERAARCLRAVSLAPFSRRALPNAAQDAERAAAAMRANDRNAGARLLSMAERSLRLTVVRRPLESALDDVARHKERGTQPSREERARAAEAIRRGRAAMFERGVPLDDGFRRRFVATTVVPKLSAVADMLSADGTLDTARAYREFSAGLAPL